MVSRFSCLLLPNLRGIHRWFLTLFARSSSELVLSYARGTSDMTMSTVSSLRHRDEYRMTYTLHVSQ